MCAELFVDGREVFGMKGLRALVGRRNIVIQDGYAAGTQNSHGCLCPVDLEATARKAGYMVVKDERDDPWAISWHKPAA